MGCSCSRATAWLDCIYGNEKIGVYEVWVIQASEDRCPSDTGLNSMVLFRYVDVRSTNYRGIVYGDLFLLLDKPEQASKV